MELNTVTQIVTVAPAVLAIIWHQQRITSKLSERRDDVAQLLGLPVPGPGIQASQ